MRKIINILTAISLLTILGCTNFLDKEPYDKFSDEIYWTNEADLRAYAQEIYLSYFIGYGTDFTVFGGFFTGDDWSDDYAKSTPKSFPRNIDESALIGKWNFAAVRKANIIISKVSKMNTISESAKQHWIGIGYFFRALAYSELVRYYGDVPYMGEAFVSTELDSLYKPRESQLSVVDKIMRDFKFAVDNIRTDDGISQVNKYVAAAYMSRSMLYHATWFKYHGSTIGKTSVAVPDSKLKSYFDAAIYGAKVVMNSGKFAIGDTYNELFTSESLAGNKEIVFYREYVSGLVANALMGYNAKEPQVGGLTKDALDDYLCNDGLPISQSSNYKGKSNPSAKGEFENRDPRLYQCFVDSIRVSGIHGNFSPTGYVCKKFLNEEWLATNSVYVQGVMSPADSPIMRYAEVLLNYLEARYEVSKLGGEAFHQDDLDLTVNKLRSRKLKKWGEGRALTMPSVELAGNNIAVNVNGVKTMINDPKRDSDVDPILWEIRRERRIELIMEGNRGNDLRRWAKFSYLNTGTSSTPTDINKGAWIVKADYDPKLFEGDKPKIVLWYPTEDRTAGYIWPCYTSNLQRTFTKGDPVSERVYLYTVPVTQINLYKGKGYNLTQTQGWE